MPWDYYEYLKKQSESEEYTETCDLVRKNIWSETINFKMSQDWLRMEDKLLIILYPKLRYT